MKVSFTVHAANVVPMNAIVDFNGQKVKAVIDSLEVELTTDKTEHGTLKLNFPGEEFAVAQALFVVDSKIVGEFSAVVDTPVV